MNPLSTNMDIRKKITEYGLYYKDIAEQLNVAPSNFSNKMKMFLTDLEREKIFEAIEKVHKRKEEEENG